MKLTLQHRGIGELTPYERNAKFHGDHDISAIAASISRFGFNDPIGITPDGVIVEGHGRFEAAKQLGLTEVPVIVLEGGDERQYDLYRIAHNKIALTTGFDFEVLVETLREVSGEGFAIEDMGFSMDFLENYANAKEAKPVNTPRHVFGGQEAVEYDIIWDNKEQKDAFSAFLSKLKATDEVKAKGSLLVRFASEHLPETQGETANVQS